MDRRSAGSQVYTRNMSSPTRRKHLGGAGGFSTTKRAQNIAAESAAQRLSEVMALRNKDNVEDENEGEEDSGLRFGDPPFDTVHNAQNDTDSSPPADRKQLGGAGAFSTSKPAQNVDAKAAAQRLAEVMASRNKDDVENEEEADEDSKLRFGTTVSSNSYLNSTGTSNFPVVSVFQRNRSSSPAMCRNSGEQVPSRRSSSAGRPSMAIRSTTPTQRLIPPSKATFRNPVDVPSNERPNWNRDNWYLSEVGSINSKRTEDQPEVSALRDELDMLQEENGSVFVKLRRAEEKREEAEARIMELEKQVAFLGEGVFLEAKLLSRKQAALRQRQAALKSAKQKNDGKDEELASLCSKLESLKDEAATSAEQLQEAEAEVKSLRSMKKRMSLSEEEMEEVVLKRCWLARYWGLALQHGVCADIALTRHEYWSALAPLPFELVISVAQKAKDESSKQGENNQIKIVRTLSDLTGDGNIESMLSVEMGLRELASLKVEEAVMLVLAQRRRPSLVQENEISEEEAEDVMFKQAWLTYFWERAKLHGVERDISNERFQFWMSRSDQSPTAFDTVTVERGLIELRKLRIEQQLWEDSRKETDKTSSVTPSVTL